MAESWGREGRPGRRFQWEDVVLGVAAGVCALGAAAGFALRGHGHPHNLRVQYGVAHLGVALVAGGLFAAGVLWVRRAVVDAGEGPARWEERPTAAYLGVLAAVFALFWLPVVLAGGFAQDDWMLLSAASIRKIFLVHPGYSWYALDSVDGNFRPLGAMLYFSFMLKLFGMRAVAFLMGNFVVNLAGTGMAFLLVREMGYSKVAGAAGAMLYASRGLIYTEVAWTAALGDGIAIFCGAVAALGTMRAMRCRGARTVGWHGLAWAAFVVGVLGKQSTFAVVLIVALVMLLRPGVTGYVALRQRLFGAGVALAVYGATAGIIFLHAKHLLEGRVPYPIELTLRGMAQSFAYVTWYLVTLQIPDAFPRALMVPAVLGLGLLAAVVWLVRRFPGLLGERPNDVWFAVGAGLASISLFVVLPGRGTTPYYGDMFVFWISIALGLMLTRMGWPGGANRAGRVCCMAFCVLVVSGFIDVRLKQTGLMPSGGYLWGTYGMDVARTEYGEMVKLLEASPGTETVVLVNQPGYPSYAASMTMLADPGVKRMLVLDTKQKTFFTNGRGGERPGGGFGELRDVQAFNWTVPISRQAAETEIRFGKTLWVGEGEGHLKLLAAGTGLE